MARAGAIESSKNGQLSPSIIQLFVYRYYRELRDSNPGEYFPDYIDHFNLARYVCKRVSEFDYHTLDWCVDGDKKASGDTLRIQHPAYPDYCLTQNLTSEMTKHIMRTLSQAVEAQTLEAFIGSATNHQEDDRHLPGRNS
jgi:hypothetical protein